MIDDKLFLTPEEILNKEFKIDARGYRMQEVDKFLDMVIRDYTEFLRTIKKLEKDNLDLIEDNKKLQMEYRKLKSAIRFVINEIIQNLTIILFSFQPFCSKWW